MAIKTVDVDALVNEWTPEALTVTLPMMGLARPMEAELVVFLPDGRPALVVPPLSRHRDSNTSRSRRGRDSIMTAPQEVTLHT